MNAKDYLANVINPATGEIRGIAELLEVEERVNEGVRRAAILAEREREAKKPEIVKRIELMKREYDHARHNDDHDRAKFYRQRMDILKEQYATEQVEAASRQAFSADRRIDLIRTEAECIARSGAHLLPHASEIDRQTLISIARSDSYPDPESQFRAFKELSDRLTDVELEAERVKQSDAAIESLRQEVTRAESKVQQTELEAMRARREAVAE